MISEELRPRLLALAKRCLSLLRATLRRGLEFLCRRTVAPAWQGELEEQGISRRRGMLTLLCSFALASLFYVWHAPKITTDLPYSHYWDEDQVIYLPLGIMQDRAYTTNPYPPLTGYMTLPLLYPIYWYDLLTGAVESADQYGLGRIQLWEVRPPYLLFYGRMAVLLWVSATLVFVYLITRQFASPSVAMTASASLFTIHQFYDSAYSLPYILHPNCLVGPVFAVSILMAILAYRGGQYWKWFLAAFWGGASVMLKYVTFPACIPVVIAWIASYRRNTNKTWLEVLALVACGGILGAYAVHPHFFDDRVLGTLTGAIEAYSAGEETRFSHIVSYALESPGFGYLSVLCVAGLFVRPAITAIIAVPVLVYLAVLGQQVSGGVMRIAGGAIVFLPVLALLGLRSLQMLSLAYMSPSRIRHILNRSEMLLAVLFLAAVCALPGEFGWGRVAQAWTESSLSDTYWRYSTYERAYLGRESNDDPRKSMAWWIRENLPSDKTVAVDRYLHLYDQDISDVVQTIGVNVKDLQLIDLLRTGADYLLLGDYGSGNPPYLDSLDVVRHYSGNSRILGRDAMDMSWRQAAALYSLDIDDPETLLFAKRYRIDGGHRIALDDFAETSEIYRTSFVNSNSFHCPWYWGPKLYSRIVPGSYRFDLNMDSFAWGGARGFPKASVLVDLLKLPFENSDFSERSLVNWSKTGTDLGDPVFLNHKFKQAYALNTAAGVRSDSPSSGNTLTSPEFLLPAGWQLDLLVTQESEDAANYIEVVASGSTVRQALPADGTNLRYPPNPFLADTTMVVRLTKNGAGDVQFGGFRLIQHNDLGEVTVTEESQVYKTLGFDVDEEVDMNMAVVHHDNTRPDTNRILRIHWIEVVEDGLMK